MQTWLHRTIGTLALGGSALGCTLIATMLFSDQAVLTKVILLLFLPAYAFGIWCGIQMIERHPDATPMNLLFWSIQIPVVQSGGFSYMLSSGLLAGVWMQFSPAKVNFLGWMGSRFELTINQSKPFAIGVNLVAVAITIILWRQLRSERSEGTFDAPAASAGASFP